MTETTPLRSIRLDVMGSTVGFYIEDLVQQLFRVQEAMMADGLSDIDITRSKTAEEVADIKAIAPTWFWRYAQFSASAVEPFTPKLAYQAVREATFALAMAAENHFGPARV